MSVATRADQQVASQQDASQPPAPKRRRRRWIFACVALALLMLIWMLPGIIAGTWLLNLILAGATAELNGSVAIESVSLGWFSPITAHGVELRDKQNRPLLQVPEVTGERSLVSILLDRSHWGRFQIQQPKFTVLTRSDGSNIEDVLANYLTPTDEPSEPVAVALEILDGSVTLIDEETGKQWQIEKVRLALNTSADRLGPLKVEASAEVADPQQPGRLKAAMNIGLPSSPDALGKDHKGQTAASPEAASAEATIEAEAVPLALFETAAARFAPDTRLAGRLSSKLHVRWGSKSGAEQNAADQIAIDADVTADRLVLVTPVLGTDRVKLSQFDVSCRIAKQGDRFDIKRSSVHSDLGNLEVAASVDLGDLKNDSVLPASLRQSCEITGHVDLARLAAMLPHSLHIREGTQVTSGQIRLALSSMPDPQPANPKGMVWQGRFEADKLTAVHLGRPLSWDRPLLITLDAAQGAGGPIVRKLKCESDFFTLQAAGTPDALAADATFDLKQLADQAGRFVDLSDLHLAGDGWGHLQWKRGATRQFETDLELQVRNFRLDMPDHRPWQEEILQVFLSAHGWTDFADDTQLQQASLLVRAGEDRADFRLIEPVADVRADSSWPIRLQMQGRLEPWLSRLGVWLSDNARSLDDWTATGTYQLTGQVTGSTSRINVQQAKCTLGQLHLASPELNVDEPQVELTASGSWNPSQRQLQLDPAKLTSNSLTMEANNVVMTMPDDGPLRLTGGVGYRANLQRLASWFSDPASEAKPRWSGDLAGTAQLVPSAGRFGAKIDAKIEHLQLVLASGERFDEPLVRLVARGDYQPEKQMLRLEQATLSSDMLSADAAGQVALGGDPTTVQLDGELKYDLHKLTGMLQPLIGSKIRMAGTGDGPFFYHGPLGAVEAQAGAEVAWQRAELYGFLIGPGRWKPKLADGILVTEPMNLEASGGRLRLAPRLRVAPEPMELTLPSGPLVEQVQITPAMCASLLKFVAPVLAGVTTAQGSFSVELDGCRVPLDHPATAELAGRLTVHSVQVGPGPLVRELAVLLGRESPATLRRESQVQFRMVDGRVYHQGMELEFPELTIRTYGSVGLDQTLAVMAEMPVPPKWLGNKALNSVLRGQTIRLPIGGTLSHPRIDRQELNRLSRQFIRNAATNLLQDELGRQLDRMFGPRGENQP